MTLADFLQTENMTQSQLAARLSVSVSTVTRILNGKRGPGFELMREIANVTDGRVTPNDFVGVATASRKKGRAA